MIENTKSTDFFNYLKQRYEKDRNGIETKFHKEGFGRILPVWDRNTTTILAGRSGEGEQICLS